jgi:hypothetical protein
MGSLQKSQKMHAKIAEEAGMFIDIQVVRLAAHVEATKVEQTTTK